MSVLTGGTCAACGDWCEEFAPGRVSYCLYDFHEMGGGAFRVSWGDPCAIRDRGPLFEQLSLEVLGQ